MKLTSVTLDFETYWTTDFSLSKLSFIEYIKSPEFEVISVAVKIGIGDVKVVFGHEQVGEYLRSIDWSDKVAVAHNGNEFDHAILTWVYDCHPAVFADTLALSKPKHQSSVGGSLKKLSEDYGLPAKDNTVLLTTKGKRYADFDLIEMRDMAQYNKVDTANTYELFKRFRAPDTAGVDDIRTVVKIANWHQNELKLCDMTARMAIYPQFDCDVHLLNTTLAEAEAEKTKILEKVAESLDLLDVEDVLPQLSSNNKFAAVLGSLGVDPPVKISKTTGKPTFAFSKTDEGLLALLEHDDERVQTVVSARLGTKSTLLETRLAKMATCGELMDGRLPIPLAYHSATTGRWGGRVFNAQNFPRIPRDKQGNIIPKLTNALRMSLAAPPGHKVVVSDLSGIELRVNHYLWQVKSSMDLYAGDPQADLYKTFAASLFGVPESDVTKSQRQLAKVAQLGLGFGAGAKTFQKVAKLMGGIELDGEESNRVVDTWRRVYYDIVQGWHRCSKAITAMLQGHEFSPDPLGLVTTAQDKLLLPSGRWLYYPGLRQEIDENYEGVDTRKLNARYYGVGNRKSKIYSGLLDENIVQAIARDVIAEMALNIWKTTGRYPALTVHDELVYVVPETKAEEHLATINSIMRTPPSWLPGIVLWSEGDIADTYGEAK